MYDFLCNLLISELIFTGRRHLIQMTILEQLHLVYFLLYFYFYLTSTLQWSLWLGIRPWYLKFVFHPGVLKKDTLQLGENTQTYNFCIVVNDMYYSEILFKAHIHCTSQGRRECELL